MLAYFEQYILLTLLGRLVTAVHAKDITQKSLKPRWISSPDGGRVRLHDVDDQAVYAYNKSRCSARAYEMMRTI